ncbi:arylesterase [Desulfobulbus oligotrophicus]|jgi:acyl-CoA thioesterase-1|nr:arylesterase [Desulfobulbus oligotrophicus]MDY0390085.1 arylesterase [Desulfobulbus oligotrophicus]
MPDRKTTQPQTPYPDIMPLILRWSLAALLLVCFSPCAVLAEQVILFLGDSLTAGLGVETDEAYPHLLGEMLQKDGITDFRIVNAGISGSTSASALSRLQWYAKIKPTVLFLALGANDGLRGVNIEETQHNLAAAIAAAQAQEMSILLAGMELPPNYGKQYTDDFRRMYRELATRYQLDFIPFLLEGVGGVPSLNQVDGIHPNVEGHRIIARHVYPTLRQHLQQLPPVGSNGP